MSEIAKCPLCGSDLDYYVSAVEGDDEPIWYECMSRSCMFSCNGPDLPRISVAMELAKLTVQMKTCRAYCPERAFLYAQDRVLEVFK